MICWEDTDDKGITAKCVYEPEKMTYHVTVSKGDLVKTESFGQTFTPTFGMDVADQQESGAIAEKLAKEIEKELGI